MKTKFFVFFSDGYAEAEYKNRFSDEMTSHRLISITGELFDMLDNKFTHCWIEFEFRKDHAQWKMINSIIWTNFQGILLQFSINLCLNEDENLWEQLTKNKKMFRENRHKHDPYEIPNQYPPMLS